jgi:hypothetical protein
MPANCVINEAEIKYCSWEDDDYDLSDEEDIRPGDILINYFMAELYRIHQKAKSDRDGNDCFILIALSKALKKVQERLSDTNPIEGKRCHFIFVVPNEWEHEIRDETVRAIFKEAGIINDIDHPCRLLFYTKLNALIFSLQNRSYNNLAFDFNFQEVDNNAILERGKHYTLYDLHPNNEKEGFLITSHSFDTIQTKHRIDSTKDFFLSWILIMYAAANVTH